MKQKILLIACGVFGLAMAAGRADLVAHYKFDETEGSIAFDELGNNHGDVGAAVIPGIEGISGTAYAFHGGSATQDDIVDMGNASFFPAIVASRQLSFSAWINTHDTTGNRNTVVFAGNDTQMNVYSDLGVAAGLDGGATARNRPVGASGPQQTGIFSTPAAAPVNDGEWHHLVMTVDLSAATNQLRLYVDGVQANQQTMTGAVAFPAFNNFEIGRLGRGGSGPVDPFEGLIDDVQVYSRALTWREVRYLFENPGKTVNPPATITSAGLDGADFRISFTGVPSATYHILGSIDLGDFGMDEGTAITDGNGEGTATIPLVPGRPRQFYSLVEVPEP